MTKHSIDQSYTSWLIYSDYLEENGYLNLAEQVRFELDYRPCNYPPPFSGVYFNYVGGGFGGDISEGAGGPDVGSIVGNIGDVGGNGGWNDD